MSASSPRKVTPFVGRVERASATFDQRTSAVAIRSWSSVGRQWLYFSHRWLGIVTCLLFAVWFFSGAVMMFVPFPALTADERLHGLSNIDWEHVKVGPNDVFSAGSVKQYPRELRLESRGDTPVYRLIDWDGQVRTISAVDAADISSTDAAAGCDIARQFTHAALRSCRTIERDQWSVAGGYNKHRPLHVAVFGDEQRSHIYVSSRTGEVVLDTTARERFWNWLGSIPHWIYFTSLRQHQPVWRQVIIWTSGVGIVGAVTGFWIGILRLRLRRRYRGERITPYRDWMKWHHIAGLIGGLFLMTWIVSGYLSVNPNRWFQFNSLDEAALQAYAGQAAPIFPLDLTRLQAVSPKARQVRFTWFDGQPLLILMDEHDSTTVRDPRSGDIVTLTDEQIFAAARRVFPKARPTTQRRLTQEDRYWYSHHQRRLMPVLRIEFDDTAHSWLHLDPRSGQILGSLDRTDRAYRWWFDALHRLDYRWLLAYRPAWDTIVLILSALGLITSITGIVIGWRRLTR